MDMIRCENLTKRFGALTSVDRLNLSVAEGELFGFLGPNGAGKTTTIKMITGLLKPTEGTVTIGGYDIRSHPIEAKRIFGYIPDNPFLYEKLTGREYLNFMADLYAVPGSGRAAKMEDLLELFELKGKGNDLIQGYSRGMRQKIALAGALIHTPKLILLDEPTVGLDPRSARTMEEVLRELSHRGTTVLISTHVLEIAERMCHRVGILSHGRLVGLGSMAELRAAGRRDERDNAADGFDVTQGESERSLEQIFFELTGDAPGEDVARYLG
jgi:ABC-2 type transport system ATP-binding protein